MENLPLELVDLISNFQDKVSDVSKLRRTCKCFYSLLYLNRRPNDNDVIILLQLFPDKFDMITVSMHPKITWDIVCKYPEYQWNYETLSCNLSISFETIDVNMDKPWSLEYLASRTDFPLWFYNKYKHLDWKSTELCVNTHVYIPGLSDESYHEEERKRKQFGTMTIEELNSLGEWNAYEVSHNSNINWNFVKLHINKEWDWRELSRNPGISKEDIFANIECKWDWPDVSDCKRVPWEEIHNKVSKRAYKYMFKVLLEALLTPEFIESHPKLQDQIYNTHELAINTNLPITYIIESLEFIDNIEIKRDWIISITSRDDFTWDLVNKYPQYEWNFEGVGG